jgi:hypothetical protein
MALLDSALCDLCYLLFKTLPVFFPAEAQSRRDLGRLRKKLYVSAPLREKITSYILSNLYQTT